MSTKSSTFNYPKPDRDDNFVENHFGIDVRDPYRSLEDPTSEKTKQFIKEQNLLTDKYLSRCSQRDHILKLLESRQNYEKIGCPFKRGDKYYVFKNAGLDFFSTLYQQDTIDGEMREFYNPNKLSEDGKIALSHTSFSPDGCYMAYGLSYGGSDWVEIRIKDVKSGEDLNDIITKAKFTAIDWTKDNKGFFYSQYPNHEGEGVGTDINTNINHTLYYHTINTAQSEDVVKVTFPEHPNWNILSSVSDCGNYLFVYPREGCSENSYYYCDLRKFKPEEKLVLIPIVENFKYECHSIGNNDNIVYVKTNSGDASNYKISKFDLNNPGMVDWIDVIPAHDEDVLDAAEIFTVNGKDYILVRFLRNVAANLELYDLEGNIVKRLTTPPGSLTMYDGYRNQHELFFTYTSFITPGQTYYFDMKHLDSEPRLLREVKPKDYDGSQFKIEQVFYTSKDKTIVPMFLVYRKDLIRDGNNPCLLYGYGGFGISITSNFNINRVTWIQDFKGILAIANIRGGGEKGLKWHNSGRLLNKQNVFDDFIAAAEYLIKENYTRKEKLVIEGASNGGLLVGAVACQKPDLFAAAIINAGVLDMTRFHKFTIGHSWTSDYGDPEKEEHFHNLFKYSPYHNIPEHTDHFPATLVLTGDHDDRVVPAHSLKFIAKLQQQLSSKCPYNPLLVRVDTKDGHGAGRSVSKVISLYGEIYSFLYNVLDLDYDFSKAI